MNLVFEPVFAKEMVVVRDGKRWLGRLIRTNDGDPVWADRDLKKVLGIELTVDGTMAEAQEQVRTILGA